MKKDKNNHAANISNYERRKKDKSSVKKLKIPSTDNQFGFMTDKNTAYFFDTQEDRDKQMKNHDIYKTIR